MNTGCPIELPGIEPIRLIGSGGFGEVWLARQTDFDRLVAVKIGRRAFATVDDRRRFERECKALGRLTGHPNVVDVHLSGFQHELPYLVMEYIDGGTLTGVGPTLDEPALLTIAAQLCDAVDAAHELGVLHRDIKPDNVLLRPDRRAVLGDFGIARVGNDNNTLAGQVTATVAFAPPEILNGQPASVQADVYGIGVTLAAAVLGRSPFAPNDDMTIEAIMARVFEGGPVDLTGRGVSAGFSAVINQAMSVDPSSRPQSAAELARRLRSLRDPQHRAPHDGGQSAGQSMTNMVGPPAGVGVGFAAGGESAGVGPPSTPSGGVKPAVVLAAVAVGVAAVAIGYFGFSGLTANGSSDKQAVEAASPSTVEDGVPVPASTDSTDAPSEPTGPSETTTPESDGSTSSTPPSGQSTEDSSPSESTAAVSPPPKPPLALPLSSTEVSDLTDIPIDVNGWDPILGPANAPQFCNDRPDITGLTETTAALYPTDPTAGNNLQQVSIRMYRFASAQQADAFMASATAITCDGWEADGLQFVATATQPPTVHGEDTRQVDQEVSLPSGLGFFTRSAFVRSDTDVMKLYLSTANQADLDPVSDRLVTQAVSSLGY